MEFAKSKVNGMFKSMVENFSHSILNPKIKNNSIDI